MTSNEIRTSFLKYFEQQQHRIAPSSSLVPADDPIGTCIVYGVDRPTEAAA